MLDGELNAEDARRRSSIYNESKFPHEAEDVDDVWALPVLRPVDNHRAGG